MSSSTASVSRAFARRSPDSATLITTGANVASLLGDAAAAHAMSSDTSLTSAAVRTAPVRPVSGSRPSNAAVTTLSAFRPIHAPLPSSPKYGPHPPQRANVPVGPRPNATDPVPAINSTPAPSPTAPSTAP